MERLEDRRVLASNLAFVQGTVFNDIDLDGIIDGGEPGLPNVQVRINGTNDLGQTINTTDLTDSNGIYRFDGLRPGTYQFTQISTPSGFTAPAGNLGTVTITSAQSDGSVGVNIDTFDDTTQNVLASFQTANQASTFSPAAPEAIGLERDLFVQMTSATGRVELSANADVPDHLDFSTISGSSGLARVVWDGPDNDATNLNATGLGGVDLTTNSADRLTLLAGTELGGNITINIYSDANRVSRANFAIPATAMALATAQVSIAFSSFSAVSGGGADFTNVGAIEMILAPTDVADGRIDTIATFGPTAIQGPSAANTSTIDLRINKSVNNSTPALGSNVVWTVQVSNDGPGNATGVTVEDTLPNGVTYVSNTTTQGTFSSGTGIWNVGNLNSGSTATMTITTTVSSSGQQVNTAQVCAANETDIDSTPCNDIASEDDQASAAIVPNVTSGINIEKHTNGVDADTIATAPTVFVGATVEFTYYVTNTGNVPLSNVRVSDDNGTTATAADDFFGTYVSGDTDGDNLLDVSEQWIYRATRVATEGIYTNKGTATALDPNSAEVMDMDLSNHLGAALPMAISKRSFLASNFR
jgi:uncharacterized repeat protein (TIGR01451 family)